MLPWPLCFGFNGIVRGVGVARLINPHLSLKILLVDDCREISFSHLFILSSLFLLKLY